MNAAAGAVSGVTASLIGERDFDVQTYTAADRRLEAAAEKAGVRCECLRVNGDFPYEQILKTAANEGCSLIYMASHGKRGTSALLLGSETAKVLTHSPRPVLVHRERRRLPVASRVESPTGR